MKIIGSGKIDDFKKVVLEGSVMKALNVKPGDSVLFYRGSEDGSVHMFRAEGARVSDECDSKPRNHMRDGPRTIRLLTLFSAVMLVALIATIALSMKNLSTVGFITVLIVWIIALLAMLAAILAAQRLDEPTEQQTLVTVGGPYSKNRITGLSKLLSDGYVVSGNLYINSLFGKNPEKVEIKLEYENGTVDIPLIKCVKTVSGYCVYKIRSMSKTFGTGKMIINMTYSYNGKKANVVSVYDIVKSEKSNDITVRESDVTASLEFDQTLNESVFDEALFDPTDDEVVL